MAKWLKVLTISNSPTYNRHIMKEELKEFSKLTKNGMEDKIAKATGLKLTALARANSSDIIALAKYINENVKGVSIEGLK